jgi:hypothetical protein
MGEASGKALSVRSLLGFHAELPTHRTALSTALAHPLACSYTSLCHPQAAKAAATPAAAKEKASEEDEEEIDPTARSASLFALLLLLPSPHALSTRARDSHSPPWSPGAEVL